MYIFWSTYVTNSKINLIKYSLFHCKQQSFSDPKPAHIGINMNKKLVNEFNLNLAFENVLLQAMFNSSNNLDPQYRNFPLKSPHFSLFSAEGEVTSP